MEENLLDLLFAEPELLRERRPVIGQVLLSADEQNGPLFIAFPYPFHGRRPRKPSADDDVFV